MTVPQIIGLVAGGLILLYAGTKLVTYAILSTRKQFNLEQQLRKTKRTPEKERTP
jgi:hypothetical protein